MPSEPAAQPAGASDHEGLICAFELEPLRKRGIDILAADRDVPPCWLHFNLSDRRACRWLETKTALPDDARELLLDDDSHIRSLHFRDGFGIVLGDLHHDFTGDPEGFGVIRIIVEPHRVITARLHPLRSTDTMRRELTTGECTLPSPIAV